MNQHGVQTLSVELPQGGYPIWIGTGLLEQLGTRLAGLGSTTAAVLVADANVARLYAEPVERSLRTWAPRVHRLVVPPGEESKSVRQAQELWQQMLQLRVDRRAVVVALGGGVTGDLAGFVAATFARGLRFVQVPTTLLAQVDSSVGGKVGINLPGAKNIVGAFWQPLAVLIDTAVLDSLPENQYRAGLAEVVKYGVILDEAFFAYLEQNVPAIQAREPHVLRQIIARSCQLKAQVVAADERETSGHRAVLNYGHTFAHALESAGEYSRWLHGEAVAVGMNCAALLARRLGRVDQPFCLRQARLLEQLGLPVRLPSDLDHRRLLELMYHDKKAQAGRLRFVLPSRLGHVELVDNVPESEVLQALREAQEFSSAAN